MIFLRKPGKPPNDPPNFRPISLLEYLEKTLESMINIRFKSVIEGNALLNNHQHRLRKKEERAVITETLASHKGHQRQGDLVLRDIQKAFDKVWITGLQYKLLRLNLPPALERILYNYVTERRAKISIEGYLGAPFPLRAGVPQGECLSPSLFIIYTSDTPAPFYHLSLNISYANDVTQIIANPSKSQRITAARTSREINNINKHEGR